MTQDDTKVEFGQLEVGDKFYTDKPETVFVKTTDEGAELQGGYYRFGKAALVTFVP